MATVDDTPWFLKSTHPVDFPFTDAFTLSKDAYQDFLSSQLRNSKLSDLKISDDDESTLVDEKAADDSASGNAFMDGLKHQDDINSGKAMPEGMQDKMLTANGDVAVAGSGDALVDLFYEAESSVSGSRLESLLGKAWKQDSLRTLKIIFNARSIHLGKSERKVFYQCAGWLATHHPQTLIANLGWLVRPVIPKKAEKKEDSDDAVIVDAVPEDENAQFDVKNGVSHGYWKDVLNILALAANGKLDVHSDPADVLNVVDEHIKASKMKKHGRGSSRPAKRQKKDKKDEKVAEVRVSRKELRDQRHATAVAEFEHNTVYRMLHVEIARLFAQQLKADIAALRGDDAKAKKNISLCAKWAPSDDLFHDKHTFIISSIAEIMYPRDSLDAVKQDDSHVVYLRHAREQYRRDVSALRKHLDVVERNITAKTYDKINYARLHSQAMMNYQYTFVQKDTEHFLKYLDEVADGKKKISGATLMPSVLVSRAFQSRGGDVRDYASMTAKQIVEHKVGQAGTKVLDGQWKSLVQRIKDSGSLDDCIAVCDVSGSMTCNRKKDGTTPLDAAIGLSLLMAEVVKPPFGGHFITFSDNPELVKIDLTTSLSSKIRHMNSTSWSMSTNFRGVFEDLILPMAKANNLKQEDMIKKIFVFSDMQFNSAETSRTCNKWSSSYETIKAMYKDAGYEMPELVFWNLAGERMGSGTQSGASAKPTDAGEDGVALVSGYSQGMLKVFMDGAGFDEDEKQDEDEMELVNEDGETETVQTKKKDPRDLVNRAVSHRAYDMLQVWD